jgi:SAM-dependent methyltransferase
VELANLPSGARILDLGCGGGESARFLALAGYDVVGVDRSLLLLSTSQAGSENRVCADAKVLPFAPNSFDAILAECTLSLFKPLGPILDSLFPLIKENGYLLISDLCTRAPNELARLKKLTPSGCLSGAFDAAIFTNEIYARGFGLSKLEDHAELLKDLLQPVIFPLVCNIENGKIDSLDLVLQIARAKLSYFLCVAKKEAHRL